MKKIDTKKELVSFKGEPIRDGEGNLTIGTIISGLLGGKVSNPTLGWVLGKKFATEEIVDLKAEEVVFIKKELEANAKLEKGFPSLIIGQVIELLDSSD